jgi:hypothetical protein
VIWANAIDLGQVGSGCPGNKLFDYQIDLVLHAFKDGSVMWRTFMIGLSQQRIWSMGQDLSNSLFGREGAVDTAGEARPDY